MLHRVIGLTDEIKYQDQADKISLFTECVNITIARGEILELVLLLLGIDNGFKIPPNRLDDRCSRKYPSFIEWSGSRYFG